MAAISLTCLRKSAVAFTFFCLLIFHYSAAGVEARLLAQTKPGHENVIAYARWLVSQNSWGVVSTISSDQGGSPFGNVASFSDGLPGQSTGIPYFYLTTLDPTAAEALKDPRSSFTISEYPLGSCGKTDPENPTCAKLTLSGKLEPVKDDTDEGKFARNALFEKHPEMKTWPKDHNFKIFKLTINDIFLINWYGGPKPITVKDYLTYTSKCECHGITTNANTVHTIFFKRVWFLARRKQGRTEVRWEFSAMKYFRTFRAEVFCC